MPQIKRNKEQEKALEFISQALNEIKQYNRALSADWKGSIQVNFEVAARGRSRYVTLTLNEGEKEGQDLVRMLGKRKGALVKEIEMKAKKFGIILDEEDIAVMGDVRATAAELRAQAEAEDAEYEAEEETPPDAATDQSAEEPSPEEGPVSGPNENTQY